MKGERPALNAVVGTNLNRDVLDEADGEQWYTCDDERIVKLSSPPDFNSSTAYVLFYSKVNQGTASRQRSRK